MRVRINIEIGHTASIRSKAINGFTHDWELFVRGVNGEHFERYVEKIVFNLHDSFPEPIQTRKHAPFSIKESGYASFNPKIDIHFKCGPRDESKVFNITYDLDITKTSVQKFGYTILNPSTEFRQRLLEGGGIPVTNDGHPVDDVTNKNRSQSASNSVSSKKQKVKDEPKPHIASKFESLFGPPLQKISNPKQSPDTKVSNNSSKTITATAITSVNSGNHNNKSSSSSSSLKSSKDRSTERKSSKEKKDKSKSTSISKDSINRSSQYNLPTANNTSNNKETASSSTSKKSKPDDKHDRHDEKRKDKTHTKDRERSKEKSGKRPPSPTKPPVRSPKHLSESPVPRANSSSNSRSETIVNKYDDKSSSSSNKKSKKEKRDKSKERDGSGKKSDKDGGNSNSSSNKHQISQAKHKDIERQSNKTADKANGAKKEADSSDTFASKDSQRDKSGNKYRLYDTKPPSAPPVDSTTMATKIHSQSPIDPSKSKSVKQEKESAERKKHKKKEKSKDRKRDRERTTKLKDVSDESSLSTSSTYKRTSNVPTTPTQNSQRASNPKVPSVQPAAQIKSEHSDSDDSESDNEYVDRSPKTEKIDSNTAYAAVVPSIESPKKHSSDKISAKRSREEKPIAKEDKKRRRINTEKQTTPNKAEECSSSIKRKMQSPLSTDEPAHKVYRKDTDEKPSKGPSKFENDTSKPYSNASPMIQKTSPDSTRQLSRRSDALKPKMSPLSSSSSNSSSSESLASPPCSPPRDTQPEPIITVVNDKLYLAQLRSLHQKIMALQNDDELQEVVEMIAATGRYEITSRTFDFDLCLLDRTTVKRLQERLG